MGYLTTIIIHNDALHSFKEHPEKFAEAIFQGIGWAHNSGKQESVPFLGYCNYISVEPSRHADDTTVYIHSGNGVLNLNPWNEDFSNLIATRPEVAEKYLNRAWEFLKMARKELKEKSKKISDRKL